VPKHLVTWIAVVDGAQARILATANSREFTEVDALSSAEAHLPTRELVSDRPGRTYESGAPAHHAIEARHDAHGLAKRAFLRGVAERLLGAVQEHRYDHLVLVAPKRQLGQLRACLDDQVGKTVTAVYGKDLTKLPAAALKQRLAVLLQPQ
jgi:protein required for attachment to host cells